MLGLVNEPKWGHLRDLHKAIKQCEPALIAVDPTVTYFGKNLEVNSIIQFMIKLRFKIVTVLKICFVNLILQAHVYYISSSVCVAFLANYDTKSAATVTFGNSHHDLPPWSQQYYLFILSINQINISGSCFPFLCLVLNSIIYFLQEKKLMHNIRQYEVPLQKYMAMMDLQACIHPPTHHYYMILTTSYLLFFCSSYCYQYYSCCLQCMIIANT